jgi:DNA-binding NarL/FixJ family response regulator
VSVTQILLVDDDNLVRKGIRYIIESFPFKKVVAEAANGLEALKLLDSIAVDMVITDISMSGMNGLELARQVKERFPSIHVLILSMHKGETHIHQALAAGAHGYLLKSADPSELKLAIESAMNNQIYLTPAISRHVIDAFVHQMDKPEVYQLTNRQREVLQLIAEGRSMREIADLLCISIKTVETHRAQIMKRLGLDDLTALVCFAIKVGMVSPED